ncbi:hypothetical protein RJ55_01440 [Drechmeria coniospora]|nr:hypothetical protein RJ55_01440 [Drechmeria coniospora]
MFKRSGPMKGCGIPLLKYRQASWATLKGTTFYVVSVRAPSEGSRRSKLHSARAAGSLFGLNPSHAFES